MIMYIDDTRKIIADAITRLQKILTNKREIFQQPMKVADELHDIGKTLLKHKDPDVNLYD